MCVCMHVIHIRPILVSFCYWRQFYMQKPYHQTPDGNQGETSSSWSPPYLSHPSLPLDKFWKSQSQSSGWYLTSNIFQKQSLAQLFGIMIVNLIWSFDWSMGCLLNIIFEYVYYGDSMGVFYLNYLLSKGEYPLLCGYQPLQWDINKSWIRRNKFILLVWLSGPEQQSPAALELDLVSAATLRLHHWFSLICKSPWKILKLLRHNNCMGPIFVSAIVVNIHIINSIPLRNTDKRISGFREEKETNRATLWPFLWLTQERQRTTWTSSSPKYRLMKPTCISHLTTYKTNRWSS